jgi:hypothetical protein
MNTPKNTPDPVNEDILDANIVEDMVITSTTISGDVSYVPSPSNALAVPWSSITVDNSTTVSGVLTDYVPFEWTPPTSLRLGDMTILEDGTVHKAGQEDKGFNIFDVAQRLETLEATVEAQKEMLEVFLQHKSFGRRVRA